MAPQNDKYLPCIEIESSTTTHASIIWLHGLGADGNDFVPIVSELQIPSTIGLRFIFPHAPMQPVTINNGYVMRAWYDILGFSRTSPVDFPGIERSLKQINVLIDREIERGMKAENIILGGFSQGAVMALTCGLQYQHKLAGIIALSGYLPFSVETLRMKHNIPIFIGHGKNDDIVNYELGEIAYQTLKIKNVDVTFKSYPAGHTVCPAEINDVRAWLLTRLIK